LKSYPACRWAAGRCRTAADRGPLDGERGDTDCVESLASKTTKIAIVPSKKPISCREQPM
jgi:hypothetical protein